MGGGVAMRAAAMAAGIGVLNGGLRGSQNRHAIQSVASAVTSSDDVKLAIGNNDSKRNSSIEKPYVEIDDRELAGVEDELFMEAGEPMPRLVFGGAPTIQEAKQATSDLSDALEKTYLSLNATDRLTDSFGSAQEQKSLTPSASNPAIQAFKLLHENHAAQNVVASIASDAHVWNAVLHNEALADFLRTHETSVVSPYMDPDVNNSSVCSELQSPKASESESAKGFMDYVEDIKQKITVTVMDMMNSLSDAFQSLFGGSAKCEYVVNPDGTATISLEKSTIGAMLMGLATMVIMVVVLKRG